MKKYWLALICSGVLLTTLALNAADSKTYQVTGPVLEVTPTKITVQKGEEKWELSRSPATKVKGDLKVGSKVTIYYSMVATEVEVKDAKTTKGTAKKSKEESVK